MLVEQEKGNFDKVIEMYAFKIAPNEVDVDKVLGKLNKEYGLKLTEKEIDTDEISKELKHDQKIATESMVSGTPTIYLDGKWDRSRNAYKEFAVKK